MYICRSYKYICVHILISNHLRPFQVGMILGKKWIFGGFRAYMFVCCLLWFCVGVQCFIFAFDVFSGGFFGVIFLLSVHRFLFHYFVKSIVDVLSKCFCWRLLRLLLRLLCFLLLLLQFMFCSDEATCILLKA